MKPSANKVVDGLIPVLYPNHIPQEERSKFEIQPQKYEQNDYRPCPSPITFYLTPIFKLLYFFCISPNYIRFDCKSGTYEVKAASIPRKLFIIILQCLNVLQYWGVIKLDKGYSAAISKLGMSYQTLYFCFIGLNISFHYIFWAKGQHLKKLLLNIDEIAKSLQNCDNCRLPSVNKVRRAIRILALAYVIFGLFYTVTVDLAGQQNILNEISSLNEFIDMIVCKASQVISFVTGTPQLWENADALDFKFKLIIAIPFCLTSAYIVMTWVFCFLMIFIWAIIFKELLNIFFQSMNRHDRRLEGNKFLKNIRDFHAITMLIENYNEIFGLSLLLLLMCNIFFISSNIWSMAGATTDTNVLRNVVMSICPIIFAANLIQCSEINKKANSIAFAIKFRFQSAKCWQNCHVGCMEEVTQGISMVHYDLQSNSIGIKGHGFFTITYGFIGTVAGAIFSYAIIIRQLE